jgi:hypothetical protein
VHFEWMAGGAFLAAKFGQPGEQAGQSPGVAAAVQPAVPGAGGAAQRGVGVPADEDRDRLGGNRGYLNVR